MEGSWDKGNGTEAFQPQKICFIAVMPVKIFFQVTMEKAKSNFTASKKKKKVLGGIKIIISTKSASGMNNLEVERVNQTELWRTWRQTCHAESQCCKG